MYMFVHFMGWGLLGFLSPPFFLFASVLYTYISMYRYIPHYPLLLFEAIFVQGSLEGGGIIVVVAIIYF